MANSAGQSLETVHPPITNIGGEHVTANYRYIAAYNEVVARISQRQQTLTLFVAIFTGLVTALVAGRDLFRMQAVALDWLMIGFPAASVALTMLNSKYERLLSILRGYLASLERVHNAHLLLPSYNCNIDLVSQANAARRQHDLTCATLIIAYNVVALGIYYSVASHQDLAFMAVLAVVASVALACVVAHARLGRVRYMPSKN
jgi:hypothetical protein